jgi:hypothetical protein
MSAEQRTDALAGLHLEVVDGRTEVAGKHSDQPATVGTELISGLFEMTSRRGDIWSPQFLHGRFFDGKQSMREGGGGVNPVLV